MWLNEMLTAVEFVMQMAEGNQCDDAVVVEKKLPHSVRCR